MVVPRSLRADLGRDSIPRDQSITIHNIGLNNIDLEGRVKQNPPSLQVITIPNPQNHLFGPSQRTAFQLPLDTALLVEHKGVKSYGIIDAHDPKIFVTAKDFTLLADEKYNLKGGLESTSPQGFNQFWHIEIIEATGGGGAYNTAYGQQVYLDQLLAEGYGHNIRVRLTVPWGSDFIQNKLKRELSNLEYFPVYGINDQNVGKNLNFSPVDGKKLTFRSEVPQTAGEARNLGISSDDVVVLNTVRDSQYLGLLEEVLQQDKSVRLFLSATDSMIKALGKGKVEELVRRSEVYISNREELEQLVGKINDVKTLVKKMRSLQSLQNSDEGKKGAVYVTFGEMGSVVLDREGKIYFQPTLPMVDNPFVKREIVNTSGCGDSYLSAVVVKEVMGDSTLDILDAANAAGHLCATQPTASGLWMSTESKIKEFREIYGGPDVLEYEDGAGRFVRRNNHGSEKP